MKQLDERGLLDLKDKIDGAKTQASELKGQQTALMNQLKTDFSCKTIEDTEKELRRIDKDIKTLKEQIQEGIDDLEEKYNKEEE